MTTDIQLVMEGGDLLPLMHFKQALIKKLGVANGFAAYKQALDLPNSTYLRLKPIESLREVAQRGYGAFFEAAPSGERFVLPPPKMIGEGDCQPLEGTTRSMFVTCLIDARIRGRSAFIEIGETAVLDHQGAELAQIDFFPTSIPSPRRGSHPLLTKFAAAPTRRFLRATVPRECFSSARNPSIAG